MIGAQLVPHKARGPWSTEHSGQINVSPRTISPSPRSSLEGRRKRKTRRTKRLSSSEGESVRRWHRPLLGFPMDRSKPAPSLKPVLELGDYCDDSVGEPSERANVRHKYECDVDSIEHPPPSVSAL